MIEICKLLSLKKPLLFETVNPILNVSKYGNKRKYINKKDKNKKYLVDFMTLVNLGGLLGFLTCFHPEKLGCICLTPTRKKFM